MTTNLISPHPPIQTHTTPANLAAKSPCVNYVSCLFVCVCLCVCLNVRCCVPVAQHRRESLRLNIKEQCVGSSTTFSSMSLVMDTTASPLAFNRVEFYLVHASSRNLHALSYTTHPADVHKKLYIDSHSYVHFSSVKILCFNKISL